MKIDNAQEKKQAVTRDPECGGTEQASNEPAAPDKTAWDKMKSHLFCCVILVLVLVLLLFLIIWFVAIKSKPINDRCKDAVEVATVGTVVRGSFKGATHDPEAVGDCVASSDSSRNPSVWYTFEGTGGALWVHAPSIAIFTGTCDDLETAMIPARRADYYHFEEGPCANNEYSFLSSPGIRYFLYVATCPCDHCSYDFDVWIEPIRFPPPNNELKQATAIPLDGSTVTGTLFNATWDNIDLSPAPNLGHSYFPPPGVWYKVLSTRNGTMTLRLQTLPSVPPIIPKDVAVYIEGTDHDLHPIHMSSRPFKFDSQGNRYFSGKENDSFPFHEIPGGGIDFSFDAQASGFYFIYVYWADYGGTTYEGLDDSEFELGHSFDIGYLDPNSTLR